MLAASSPLFPTRLRPLSCALRPHNPLPSFSFLPLLPKIHCRYLAQYFQRLSRWYSAYSGRSRHEIFPRPNIAKDHPWYLAFSGRFSDRRVILGWQGVEQGVYPSTPPGVSPPPVCSTPAADCCHCTVTKCRDSSRHAWMDSRPDFNPHLGYCQQHPNRNEMSTILIDLPTTFLHIWKGLTTDCRAPAETL